MKKKTITIGIPAYNEKSNVKKLLIDVLSQKFTNSVLEKIVVVSDGSNDNTVKEARKVKDPRILIVNSKKNLGKAKRQNEIIDMSNSDILIILDADIKIKDESTLDLLVHPIETQQADLTSSKLEELPARTFFEKILDTSMVLKEILFTTFNNGNNVYTCHGPARAFSKRLYKRTKFSISDGEDMYTYLRCKELKYKFKYVNKSVVKYRLPKHMPDHYKQSVRYHDAINYYKENMRNIDVEKEFKIPFSIFAKSTIKAAPVLVKRPIISGLYVVLLITVKAGMLLRIKPQKTWGISSSKLI